MLTHHRAHNLAEDSDIIFIQDLKITTCIGVYNWEKNIPQTLILNLQLAPLVPFPVAAAEDDLTKTIDYAEIIQWLKSWIPQQKIQLVETLAENIAQILLTNHPIKCVQLSIHKPNAQPHTGAVGISICRHRKEEA